MRHPILDTNYKKSRDEIRFEVMGENMISKLCNWAKSTSGWCDPPEGPHRLLPFVPLTRAAYITERLSKRKALCVLKAALPLGGFLTQVLQYLFV